MWAFILTLTLLGYPIEVTIKTPSEEACLRVHRFVERAYFDEHRGVGAMSDCARVD